MIEGLGSRRGLLGVGLIKGYPRQTAIAVGDGDSAVFNLNWYFGRRGFAENIRPAFLLN